MAAWSDVIRGCAIGDAWGRELERKDYDRIVSLYGERGPELPDELVITDDTQMSLYLARALNQPADKPVLETVMDVRNRIIHEWKCWEKDPENYRAPGDTCLSAIRSLPQEPYHWSRPRNDSDGSGAVMRVWATAFLPDDMWAGVAMLQSVSTHGSHIATVSSVIAAAMVRNGFVPGHALATAHGLCSGIDMKLRHETVWIPDEGVSGVSFRKFSLHLLSAMETVRHAIERAQDTFLDMRDAPWKGDPSVLNPGWRSHDALACAALCIDLFPDDPVSAVRRAVTTDGDSDTLGAITGALAGAVHPFPWKGLPYGWFERLEPIYRRWIRESDSYVFS